MPINRRVKRRLILLSILLASTVVLLGAAVVFARWNKERKVDQNYQEGMAAYEAGDYVQALPKLSFAVSNRKDDIPLTLAFADTRLRNVDETGQHIKGAINIYRHILTLEPNNEEAIRALLTIYVGTGLTAEALTLSRKLPTDDAEGIRARIAALSNAGRTEQAIEEVASLRKIDPEGAEWPFIEFQLRSSLDETPQSLLQRLAEYRVDHPNNQTLAFLEVPILREADQREQATEAARQLANLPNLQVTILLDLHDHLRALGLTDDAARILEQANDSAGSDPEIANALIRRNWRRSNINKARSQTQDALIAFPDDLRFHRYNLLLSVLGNSNEDLEPLLAELLEKSNQVDTARAKRDALIVDSVRLASDSDSNSLRPAIESLQIAIASNTQNEMLQYLYADALERSGQTTEAIQKFESLFERTRNRSAGIRLVNGMLRTQQPVEALRHVNVLFSLFPTVDVFQLRAQTWLALARSGRDPVALDSSINSGTTATQLIRRAYGQIVNTNPEETTPLLQLLAESAALENRDQDFEFAVNEALSSKYTSPEQLLTIAQIAAEKDPTASTQLIELADERGAKAFDLAILELRPNNSDTETGVGTRDLYEMAAEFEAGSNQRRNALRRLLAVVALPNSADETDYDLVQLIFEELQDQPACRLVLANSQIWNVQPTLAQSALDRLGELTGTDSMEYVIADTRRIAAGEKLDPAIRAQAIMNLDAVLQRSPGSVEAMLIMADLLLDGDMPDYTRAAGYLQSALDSRPGQVQLYPRLIQLLQEIGDRDRALEYIQRYQEVANDDAQATRARIALLIRQGALDEAIDAIKQVVAETNDTLDRIALAQLLTRQGRINEAIGEYNRILTVEPENSFAIEGKALLLARQGNTAEALKVIEASGALEATDQLRTRIRVLLTSGNIEQGLQELENLIAIAPNESATWNLVATLRLQAGDTDGARTALEQTLKIEPTNTTALMQLTPMLVAQPKYWEEARTLLPKLEESAPALAKALALSMEASNSETGALRPSSENLAESLALVDQYPGSLDTRRLAWILHTAAQNYDQAFDIAKESMTALPSSTIPTQWGYRSAVRAGRWEDALTMAYANRDRQPIEDRLESELQLAALCLYLGRTAEATMVIDQFIPILNNDDAIYELTGPATRTLDRARRPAQQMPARLRAQVLSVVLASGDIDRAYRLFNDLVEENPQIEGVWLQQMDQIDPEDAQRALTLITPRLSASPSGLYRLAQAWTILAAETKDPIIIDRAQSAITQAATNGGTDSRNLGILRGSLASALGNDAETISMLRENLALFSEEDIEAIKQVPSLPPQAQQKRIGLLIAYVMTLNNLAYHQTLIEDGNLEEAEELIDEALSIVPTQMRPELLDTKASILTEQENYAEAIDAITRATRMAPQRADFKLRMVEILQSDNQSSEAFVMAEQVLNELLDAPQPDLTQIDRAKELLKELEGDLESQGRVEEMG